MASRNITANGAHSFSCGFCFTSYKDWQRHNEKLLNLLPLWCSEHFLSSFFLSRGRGTMKSQRTSHWCEKFFCLLLQIDFINCLLKKQRGASPNFQGLSHDEGRVGGFCQNSLRLSIFWGIFDRLPLSARSISRWTVALMEDAGLTFANENARNETKRYMRSRVVKLSAIGVGTQWR